MEVINPSQSSHILGVCLTSLSLETIYQILFFLPYLDVISFCNTNTKYYNIIKDEYFWKKKAKLDFGDDSIIFINDGVIYGSKKSEPFKAYLELFSQYNYFPGYHKFNSNMSCFLLAVTQGNFNLMNSISLKKEYFEDISFKYHLCDDISHIGGMIHFANMINEFSLNISESSSHDELEFIYKINLFLIGLNGSEQINKIIRSSTYSTCSIIESPPSTYDLITHYADFLIYEKNNDPYDEPVYVFYLLKGLIIKGDVELFIRIYDKYDQEGSIDYDYDDECVYYAALCNNIDIANYFLDMDPDEYLLPCFEGALEGNHFDMADKILRRGLIINHTFCYLKSINPLSLEYLSKLGYIKHVSSLIIKCNKFDIIKLFLTVYIKFIEDKEQIKNLIQSCMRNAIQIENEYLATYVAYAGLKILYLKIN